MTKREEQEHLTYDSKEVKLTVQQVTQAKEKAVDWFLHSGIQQKESGGVYAWYDPQKKQYSFLYPEITGYAISLFLYLYETEHRPLFLERAVQAARWILDFAWDHHTQSIPFRFYHRRPLTFPYAYTFDSAMVLIGLVQLASLTGEKCYQEKATQIGEWLCHTMQNPEGGFFCFWDPKQRLRLISPDKWSTIPWAFLTKVARSLVELGSLTGTSRYFEAGQKVCEWAVESQQDNGRYPILPNNSWMVSHPFLYAIEGLFLCSQCLGRSDFSRSAQQGLQWLAGHQSPSEGTIPAETGEHHESYHVRSDVQAQFLRMAILIPEAGISFENLLSILKGLLSFQSVSSSKKREGGFQFAIDLDKSLIPHSNAWCTLFAIQTLSLLEEWLEGGISTEKHQSAIRFFA